MLATRALLAAVVFLASPLCLIALASNVKIQIDAHWESSSFLIQCLEAIEIEQPSTLFPFLSLLTSKADSNALFSPAFSPKQTFEFIEQRLSLLFKPAQLESLGLSIANREGSVRIEGAFKASQHELGKLGNDFDCENWIEWYGKTACTVEEFWTMVDSAESKTGTLRIKGSERASISHLYPFDHLSTSSATLPLALLYASPTDSSFSPLFNLLRTISTGKTPRLQFAMRWKGENMKADGKREKLGLSGFGGYLAIKNTDYLVVDDREVGDENIVVRDESEITESHSIESVEKRDIQLLGLRAIEYIINCEDVLGRLVEVTSRFPVVGPHLSSFVPNPSEDLMRELSDNSMVMSSSSALATFAINGKELTENEVLPLTIISKLRAERNLFTNINDLHSNLTHSFTRDLLMSTQSTQSQTQRFEVTSLGNLFDASDREEGSNLILYWNDLEKDARYNTWSPSIRDILKPTYPGQLNSIARNMNQLILVLDFSTPEASALITQLVSVYVSRGIPIQFGLVPLMGEAAHPSTLVGKVLWYLVDTGGRAIAMSFLEELLTVSNGNIDSESIKKTYDRIMSQSTLTLSNYDDVQELYDLPTSEGSLSKVQKAKDYSTRLGIKFSTTPGVGGAFFLNGLHFAADAAFTNNLQSSLPPFIQFLQQATHFEEIDEFTNLSTYFYDLPTTFKRRNQYIESDVKIINLSTLYFPPAFVEFSHMEGVSLDETFVPAPIVTIYCIVDLDTTEGRDQVREALKFVDHNLDSRISFIHNPSTFAWPSHPFTLSDLIYLLLQAGSLHDVLPIEISSWLDLDLETGPPVVSDGSMEDDPILPFLGGATTAQTQASITYWQSFRPIVASLGFLPGQTGIVINGRVIGIEGIFSKKDFDALKSFELRERIMPVVQGLNSTGFEFNVLSRSAESHLISSLCSILAFETMADPTEGIFGAPKRARKFDYRNLRSVFSGYIGPRESTALFEIAVTIDPATEIAQKWAPILLTLSKLDSVHLRIYFKAVPLQELPISRFYQYSFDHRPTFDANGEEIRGGISFERIPTDTLFSYGSDVPKAWVVLATQSFSDLDNIKLAVASSRVEARLELRNLLVEGHAREMPSGAPPRGLQVELESIHGSENRVGTIVMENLGYFQLKATPGTFKFSIREGRGRELFELESVGAEGWKSEGGDDSLSVLTLSGLTIYPRVRRRAGYETAELYDGTGSKSEGVVDKIKSMFPFFGGQTGATDLAAVKRAEINIFTVASGLLYERMAFLMIISVLRHTQSTCKFWFIQNFLSPSFVSFIPHMALHYGFEYELVTYNWPHFLRAQPVKQREIWGYKILFLDVLFPLELDRIIFVDSDQIVRADLKELIDMDLHGAPYAYAPMGDDRVETESFRFWKTGYWKAHLKGLPYHISALYVVDLNRFRSMGAGDRLRTMYQGLSADKNSLSNLDQDLPNNMQTSLPIHTLDRSWLWCETWCSDESLAQAKTIDLCNNPLTHEPKLLRAKRIIKEWEVYDEEISELAKRVSSNNVFVKAGEQSVEKENFEKEIETERIKDEL